MKVSLFFFLLVATKIATGRRTKN